MRRAQRITIIHRLALSCLLFPFPCYFPRDGHLVNNNNIINKNHGLPQNNPENVKKQKEVEAEVKAKGNISLLCNLHGMALCLGLWGIKKQSKKCNKEITNMFS